MRARFLGAVAVQRQRMFSDVETAYYMRMTVKDVPGVMSKVAQILSDSQISIEALIQKEAPDGIDEVPLILLTNRTLESKLDKAVAAIEALDAIHGTVTRIRVEHLAG